MTMLNKDKIRNWRDALLSPDRVNADGLVWSSSLEKYVPMTSKAVIAVLDWVINENYNPPKYEHSPKSQTGGHPPRRGRGLNGANPIVNGEIKEKG